MLLGPGEIQIRVDSGLEGSDVWGHTIEPGLVLLNSLKIGIHAKRGPSSRLSHYNRPCNCHSSHTPSTTVTHHACKTQTRSAALMAGSPLGNTCDVNGALLHKLSMPVNEPIHKHTGLSEP